MCLLDTVRLLGSPKYLVLLDRYLIYCRRWGNQPKNILSEKDPNLNISANPVIETQPQTLILGYNMSSVVTVPIFGKKFAKME